MSFGEYWGIEASIHNGDERTELHDDVSIPDGFV